MNFAHSFQTPQDLNKPKAHTPALASTQDNNKFWTQLSQSQSTPTIQRKATPSVSTAPAVETASGTPQTPAPAVEAPIETTSCETPEEEAKKKAFKASTKKVTNFRPSAGYGIMDASYTPWANLMFAKVKMKFNYQQADDTPDNATLLSMIGSGKIAEVQKYFWTEAQKQQFEVDYTTRVSSIWSLQHTFKSKKPCWPFSANPIVYPDIIDSESDAHYKVSVTKMSDPTASRGSSFSAKNDGTADWQGAGKLDENDVKDKTNFRSTETAKSERERLERAIASTMVSPVLFDHNAYEVKPADKKNLAALASLMKQKNPSDAAIPTLINGFASAEGDVAKNQILSQNRADAVRDVLQAAGVPQPLVSSGHGPIGAANDANNRKVELAVDSTFENSYTGNNQPADAHEFGHALGLSDEYKNITTGDLGTKQTNLTNLALAAGVLPPDKWGDRTSSLMASGKDVLPRHYLTLWEALGKMTEPDIKRDEWEIT